MRVKPVKQQLYEYCLAYVEERMNFLSNAIAEVQQSANEETKSSAGDKYETARAMAQLDAGRLQVQLAEVIKTRAALERMRPDSQSTAIKPGSLVFTSRGNFYLSISAEQVVFDGKTFIPVSPASPIAQKMLALGINSSFYFNRQQFLIEEIQ